MYRHIVMFWLKDPSDEAIALAREKLRSLSGKIEGLLSVEVERDALGSDRSCDLCLNMLFDSKASLDAYRTHPAHLPVQKHMHAVRERSASADYPLDKPARDMPGLYAQIGPASTDVATLEGLLDAGMTGVLINLAHATCDDVMPTLDALHSAAAVRGIVPDVLLDDVPRAHVTECLLRTGASGLIMSRSADSNASPRKRLGAEVRLLGKVSCEDDVAALPVLLEHADALVIARGGMSRNLPQHRIPSTQKSIAGLCRACGKPFMLAAELLASMMKSPFPTTAELCDIHNAVADGASSLALTREVALGDFPVLAMQALRRAAEEAVRV